VGQVVFEHPFVIAALWAILMLVHLGLRALNWRIYKQWFGSDTQVCSERWARIVAICSVWIAFGAAFLIAYGRGIGSKSEPIAVTGYFIVVGLYYGLVAGWIIRTLKVTTNYILYKGQKVTWRISDKKRDISSGLEYVADAILVLLCFAVSGSFLILGAAAGLLFAAYLEFKTAGKKDQT
jgi:hypothetical protein